MTAPQATEQVVAPPTTEQGRLHRPGRAVVALVELVGAGLAVWGAFWAWPHGFATISSVVAEGTVLESQRIYGNWLAAAIGFGTIAALLVVDAVRQILLAVRTKPRRAKKNKASEPASELAAEPEAASDARVTGDD